MNAERIEGVDDDEDTADEDPQDVAYEDEMGVRVSMVLRRLPVSCPASASCGKVLLCTDSAQGHASVQDAEAAREVAKQERERLRKQDQQKRQRLEEMRSQQNNSAEASEVSDWTLYIHRLVLSQILVFSRQHRSSCWGLQACATLTVLRKAVLRCVTSQW